MKSIIVVASEDLKSFGRELVHAISKTKVAQASLFTPKQYSDNEYQITGSQYVIFLGENSISKDFIPLIQKRFERQGIVWGYDNSKATIYIKNNNIELEVLEKEMIPIKKEEAKKRKSFLQIYLTEWVSLHIPFSKHDFKYYMKEYYKKIEEKEKIKSLQYELGIITFIRNGFNEFIKG